MAEGNHEHHVVMFPWLAFGHMLPFCELSKKLAATKCVKISFVSTPRNIARLPKLPPNLSPHFDLVEMNLPSTDGLPSGAEATIDLKQQQQVQYLKKAYDELQGPVERLLDQIKPDFIVCDFAPSWIPGIAAKFKVPSAFFSVFPASFLTYVGPPSELRSGYRSKPEDYAVAPNWIHFPSTVAYRLFQATSYSKNIGLADISGKSTAERMAKIVEGCDFVMVRGCREFACDMNVLTDIYQKPVLPIGLLPPQSSVGASSSISNETTSDMFVWLDKQVPQTVVFVGFGSECKMAIDRVHELAYGIELSSLPFLWILRKPEEIDMSDLLPPGFEDRTSNRGLVCIGWAPQVEILAHAAIGGCLFHSGWGTIIESLNYGHNQILLPMIADQGLNAKLLVEKGIGFEVERNEDGSFTRDAVAEAMRLVMVDPEGEHLRVKATQMRSIFSNQALHDGYINKFIDFLNDYKNQDHPSFAEAAKSELQPDN
ncbi:hypothetical protein MKW98_002021 [Papaver atlanticum]|uniref:Uncharacterized protein n=1 Tax=Papaver atlanticum TaxID=357466 RepID=A0AAD4SPE2_9MAGN|nr:hypothetical protein MKW98_002021 [Papaver atlanticum]